MNTGSRLFDPGVSLSSIRSRSTAPGGGFTSIHSWQDELMRKYGTSKVGIVTGSARLTQADCFVTLGLDGENTLAVVLQEAAAILGQSLDRLQPGQVLLVLQLTRVPRLQRGGLGEHVPQATVPRHRRLTNNWLSSRQNSRATASSHYSSKKKGKSRYTWSTSTTGGLADRAGTMRYTRDRKKNSTMRDTTFQPRMKPQPTTLEARVMTCPTTSGARMFVT
ncbi:hypothetical protein EYF80_011371 [Liparis tanakae]|uniref:Uncharacterized protein n=1 Tax=Liparis tanakae TaxID=230148 RepID=A0A4Z2IKX7_9TELE|nr:hypothetical protein EYF80_011371 [Liparis tanakae]